MATTDAEQAWIRDILTPKLDAELTAVNNHTARQASANRTRDGVTVEERLTGGADENEQLLHSRKSGVDVAFMHGEVVRPRDPANLTQLDGLRYKRLAICAGADWIRRATLSVSGRCVRADRARSPR